MLKYCIPIALLLIVSCGTNSVDEKAQEKELEKGMTAKELLDSAQVLNKIGEPQAYQSALALIDQAIEKDPEYKTAYISKTTILAKIGDDAAVLKNMEIAEAKFPNDPYLNLHLGIEYELNNDTALAHPLYDKSLDNFIMILDTMAGAGLQRNSMLMNMAMADVLSPKAQNKARISEVLSESEMDNFRTSEESFSAMDRQALLNLRR